MYSDAELQEATIVDVGSHHGPGPPGWLRADVPVRLEPNLEVSSVPNRAAGKLAASADGVGVRRPQQKAHHVRKNMLIKSIQAPSSPWRHGLTVI